MNVWENSVTTSSKILSIDSAFNILPKAYSFQVCFKIILTLILLRSYHKKCPYQYNKIAITWLRDSPLLKFIYDEMIIVFLLFNSHAFGNASRFFRYNLSQITFLMSFIKIKILKKKNSLLWKTVLENRFSTFPQYWG